MNHQFKQDDYTAKTLDKLREQGHDLSNIRVAVTEWKLVNGVLTAILEPREHIKDDYELRAKKDCSTCKGHGWIRYFLAQDDVKSAPCHVCFPETAPKSEWMRRAVR